MYLRRVSIKLLIAVPLLITSAVAPMSAHALPKMCVEGIERPNTGKAYCCFWDGDTPKGCGTCPGATSAGCTVETITPGKLRCRSGKSIVNCQPIGPIDERIKKDK